MQEIADGIWRWTARHPGKWGAEMVSYGLSGRARTFLVDPLAPEGDEEFGAQLDGVVSR